MGGKVNPLKPHLTGEWLPLYYAVRATVAQLVEQCTENAWVAGSSPACGTTNPDLNKVGVLRFITVVTPEAQSLRLQLGSLLKQAAMSLPCSYACLAIASRIPLT